MKKKEDEELESKPSGEMPPVVDTDDFDDTADVDKIREVLANADMSGGFIRVKRKGPSDQVYQYVTRIPVEAFDYEHIKKVFGGGDYQCTAHRSKGTFYKGPFVFSIDYRYKGAMDDEAMRRMSAMDKTESNQVLNLLARMQTGGGAGNESLPLVMKLVEQSSKRTEDTMALIMTMMMKSAENQVAMITGLFTAMMGRQAPDQSPVLIELIKNSTNQKTNLLETIAVIKELKDLTEAGPEEDMLDKVLKYGAPALANIMGRGLPPANVNPPLEDNNRPVAHSPLVTGAPIHSGPGEMSAADVLVGQLIGAAKRNSDPELWCDVVFDLVPPGQLVQLKELLGKDNWLELAFNNHPEVVAHAAWFNSLRDLLLSDEADFPEEPSDEPKDEGAVTLDSRKK